MFPGVDGFHWSFGHILFLSLFFAVALTILTTVVSAVWRTVRDFRTHRAIEMCWKSDFAELPVTERRCRHELAGRVISRMCDNAFDCRECGKYSQFAVLPARGIVHDLGIVGLGEDGPTHQPVEHYAALRAIPGLDFVRPADANETAVAWRTILEHNDRPAGLSLSRQNLPVFDRTEFASAEGVARGGYVLAEASGGTPAVILMGTGSEVQIAVAAREGLEADGVPTRVVSLPCWEWFAAQDRAYREQVLPPTVRARVSVEAGVPMGWREFVGDTGRIVGLDHFGASAAYTVLYEQFGLTADAVVAAARESLAAAGAPPAPRPVRIARRPAHPHRRSLTRRPFPSPEPDLRRRDQRLRSL